MGFLKISHYLAVMALTFSLPTITFGKSNSKASSAIGALIASEGQYANTLPSLSEYLTQQERFGVITKTEREELQSFLTKQGVDLKSRVPKVKVIGRALSWGEVTITANLDGTLITKSGRIIHPSKKVRYIDAFKQTFNTLTDQPIAANYSTWFLPSANAGAVGNALDKTGAALSTAGAWVTNQLAKGIVYGAVGFSYGVGSVLTAFGTVACGVTVMPVSFLKYQLRMAIYNKTVECSRGKFVYLDYPSYQSTVGQDFDDGWTASHFLAPKTTKGTFSAACAGPFGDLLGITESSYRSADSQVIKIKKQVSPETLKKAFGGSGEKCNEENLAKVEAVVKQDALALEEKLAAETNAGGVDLPPGFKDAPTVQ